MSIDKMKALLLGSPYPWWQWDVEGNDVTFSPLKANMIGYDEQELADGGYQAFTSLVHPDDLDRVMKSMLDVLQGKANLYQVDYRILAKNGEYHWYMDRGVVLETGADGRPKTIRGIVIDLGKEGAVAGSPELVRVVILNSLLQRVDVTTSFLSICSGCKKVKAQAKEYVEITDELHALLSAETTHGICPDCIRKLYPEYSGNR